MNKNKMNYYPINQDNRAYCPHCLEIFLSRNVPVGACGCDGEKAMKKTKEKEMTYHQLRQETKDAWQEYYAAIDRQASQAEIDRLGDFAEAMESAESDAYDVAMEEMRREEQVKAAIANTMYECIKCGGHSIGIICADCVEDEYYQLQAELDENELQAQLRIPCGV